MSTALGPASRLAAADFGSPALDPAAAAACRVFSGVPAQVAHARRFVAGVLSGLAAADDVVLCVSELASNAVLHSDSRRPGGQFVVRAGVTGAGQIRAEVQDLGGPWTPDPDIGEERGRGLLIVAGLATHWGIAGGDAGRTAWLELDPDPLDGSARD
jgi:serine/threonine-protein kinase RsbW